MRFSPASPYRELPQDDEFLARSGQIDVLMTLVLVSLGALGGQWFVGPQSFRSQEGLCDHFVNRIAWQESFLDR